jgi:hypothetical protein
MEDWEKRFKSIFSKYIREEVFHERWIFENLAYPLMPEKEDDIARHTVETKSVMEGMIDFISQEIERAREEGFKQGYKEAGFDMAIKEALESDDDFIELVSKIAEKFKERKEKEKFTLPRCIWGEEKLEKEALNRGIEGELELLGYRNETFSIDVNKLRLYLLILEDEINKLWNEISKLKDEQK